MAHPDAHAIKDLWAVVRTARDRVSLARQGQGVEQLHLVSAQKRLLAALEGYVAALQAVGVSPTHHLVTEMNLLRRVTALDRPRQYRTRPDA